MNTALSIPTSVSYQGGNHIHLMMCLLIFISACSVLKEKSFYQADSLSTRKMSHEQKKESNVHSNVIRVYNRSDSTEKQSFVEIIPRGAFKYSEAEGFHGEAERLLISGRIKERKHVRDFSRFLQKSNLSSAIKSSEEAVIKTRLKKKGLETANLKLMYLGACVLIFALIYRYRRFF